MKLIIIDKEEPVSIEGTHAVICIEQEHGWELITNIKNNNEVIGILEAQKLSIALKELG